MSIQAPTQAKEGILLESGTNEVEFIEFYIGKVSYGINVAKVQRVIAKSGVHITKVPHAPDAVMGVIHIQEKPILLLDLRKALHVQAESVSEERQLILVARFNRITTAYLIDGVSKIHRTSWDEFEPLGEHIAQDASGYTTGTVKIGNRIVLILDLERLMVDYIPMEQESVKIEKKTGRESIKIVYAEDSKMIRRMMLNTLHDAGYTNVQVFEHGLAAHEYINQMAQKAAEEGKELNDYIDLIVTDIEMPKMDGLTLCKNVKTASGGKHIPSVVVFSSLINDEMAKKCKSVGADAQISKPYGDEIVRVMDGLCFS